MIYDVIIVGAGPAGMMAAHYLGNHKVLVIEKGASMQQRAELIKSKTANPRYDAEVEGIAGAGGWSDGKLCLGPVGILDAYLTDSYASETAAINALFMDILGDAYKMPNDRVGELSLDENITQEVTPVANLGTSATRKAFEKIQNDLEQTGIRFMTEDSVSAITKDYDTFKVMTGSTATFETKNIIVATGKCDLTLMPELINRFNLTASATIPTIGVRLIVPREELRDMKAFGNNPKLRMTLRNGDIIKTHCFAFGGEAMTYAYGHNVLVGGRAGSDHLTDYATVAVLYKLSGASISERRRITDDLLRTMQYDHPGKAIYQSLASFMERVGPLGTAMPPDIKRCESGDLRRHFPAHILDEMRDFINVLMKTYHMRGHDAIVVGPAAEWLNDTVKTSLAIETEEPGLYVVGDVSGITQGIIASSVAGYRAALDITKHLR
jgi:uncharacterized protein